MDALDGGSWQFGETIRFLAPGGDGMVARIAENRLYEAISKDKYAGATVDSLAQAVEHVARPTEPRPSPG